ncbi:peroxisomal membrane protein 13-like isoform X2 [Phragmites australis]|uniref:peroxisomal membrane protein 13-like isoform X2 n=1 Tax=Phragmites australis TaxID=29695 RepID=UPI002D7A3FEB|nr:peroxisomal membrane protein 13-like isoform X2 [Phragmites australis]
MSGSPPKPWERSGAEGTSGPAPFKPPSGGSTSDVVEASGTAKPGENITATERNVSNNVNGAVSRPMPQRPWQQTGYGNTHGGYGGSNMYSSYGGVGNTYGGGGLYGNSMYSGYGGGYGGGLYGGSGMYGGAGGMYGGGMGGYGGYGMGGMGGMGGMSGMGMGPYGNPDPNSLGPPASPPGFWVSFLRVMHGVVNFFGRISFLVEQNTQASYFFMTAMLQLFDRSGMLYGELARFVLRLLGVRRKPKKGSVQGPEAPTFEGPSQQFIEAPKANNNWDNVWGN